MGVIVTGRRNQVLEGVDEHAEEAVAVGHGVQVVPVGVELAVVGVIIRHLAVGKRGVAFHMALWYLKTKDVWNDHRRGGVHAVTYHLQIGINGIESSLLPFSIKAEVLAVATNDISSIVKFTCLEMFVQIIGAANIDCTHF